MRVAPLPRGYSRWKLHHARFCPASLTEIGLSRILEEIQGRLSATSAIWNAEIFETPIFVGEPGYNVTRLLMRSIGLGAVRRIADGCKANMTSSQITTENKSLDAFERNSRSCIAHQYKLASPAAGDAHSPNRSGTTLRDLRPHPGEHGPERSRHLTLL